MLGRKNFTADEMTAARKAVAETLQAFAAAGSPDVAETVYFNNALLALDRRFVHRVRMVTGKEGTPLNELELLVSSLMDHDGTFTTTGTVIKYDASTSVLGLKPGDRVALSSADFERVAAACVEELAAKFA